MLDWESATPLEALEDGNYSFSFLPYDTPLRDEFPSIHDYLDWPDAVENHAIPLSLTGGWFSTMTGEWDEPGAPGTFWG